MTFDEIKRLCEDVRAELSLRNTANREYEQMFLLNDPGDLPDAHWIKKTFSPDARNALLGAVRLLTAADPKFSVPEEYNRLEQVSSTLEKVALAIWRAAGRAQMKPRHYDVVLSGLLYGEVILAITCVRDLMNAAPKSARKRYELLYNLTPVLFDVINPTHAYPIYDHAGLAAYHSYRAMSVRDIRAQWSKAAAVLEGARDTDTRNIGEYWDYDQHLVWIDDTGDVLWDGENEWGFIPIAAAITEGSNIFTDPGQHKRQPFLYTLWRSGLWRRQNLALTLMYSLAFSIGANPLFAFQRNDPTKANPEIDFTVPGGMVILDQGENIAPLAKNVIDPSLANTFELANQKVMESTIYRQALGEPLGANAPFSMVALLSQMGRLPLVPYQRVCSHVIGDAMGKALMMLKKHGESFKVRDESKLIDIDPAELPETIEIEATLDIDLPQDYAQNARIAAMVTQGETPLMSIETAREKFLGLEQPEEETRKIWRERAAYLEFMTYLQQQQAMQQAQAQQEQAAAMPPEQMPMPPGAESLPPEPQMPMPGEQAPGMPGVPYPPLTPNEAPLPPRYMQGMEA